MRKLLALPILVLFLGCSTVTVTPEGSRKRSDAPTHEERLNYFLWGLVGEPTVDVRAMCQDRAPVEMQAQSTFVDSLLTLITLGIYAPRSVRVWCP